MKHTAGTWLLRSLQPFRLRIFFIFVSAILISIAAAAQPLLIQRIVDGAVARELDLLSMYLMMAVAVIGSIPLTFIQRQYLSGKYRHQLRGKLFQQLLTLDLGFHDNRGSTKVVTEAAKGVSGADRLVQLLSNGQVIVQIPIAILAATYIGYQNPFILSLLLGFLVLFAVTGYGLGNKITKAEAEWESIDTNITDRHREAVFHIGTVKLHRAEKAEMDRYWQSGGKALRIRLKLSWLYSAFQAFSSFGTYLAALLVIFFLIPDLLAGDITVGTFFAVMMYAERVVAPATFLGDLYAEIKRELAKVGPLLSILKAEPKVIEAPSAIELPSLSEGIDVSNVSFSYGDVNAVPVLRDVSLHIPAGSMTAFVGETGSGKTTLAKLLARFYDPAVGQIAFDGTNVRSISEDSLRQQIAYVQQEVPIFTGTVLENVALGIPNPDEDAVHGALSKAAADFVYEEGFAGLETVVGETGKKLSGGQRQRVALARIFMRKPSVIILDEATAALDNATEQKVQDSLLQLARNQDRTMVVIAHRLSTVQQADQIVVLDKGRVAAVGTHETLLKSSKIYQRLNKYQLGT